MRGILAAQPGVVTAVAYSPGGKTLAAGYRDGTIRLWDVASHRLISTASWGGAALTLAFTGGGKTLEVAGPAAVGVWDLTNQATIAAQRAARASPAAAPSRSARTAPPWPPAATTGTSGCGTSPPGRRSARR